MAYQLLHFFLALRHSGSHPINTAPSLSASLPALPLLLPLSHQDSGQEWCWKIEWWEMEGSVLPFQRSCPRTCLSRLRRQKPAAVHRCRFHITVMHVSVDMLDVFTWTRKCVIWWRALLIPGRPPLPSYQKPQARHQTSALGVCQEKGARLYFICQKEQY